MSNCSDDIAARMLEAVAHECQVMAGEIAWLGGLVSAQVMGGDANMVALQAFDFLAQHAAAQAFLVARLARSTPSRAEMAALLEHVPLPAVRQRLQGALDGRAVTVPLAGDDAILWLDAAVESP